MGYRLLLEMGGTESACRVYDSGIWIQLYLDGTGHGAGMAHSIGVGTLL